MNKKDIVVCGAGIVGLSTALALAKEKQNIAILAHRYKEICPNTNKYDSRVYAISESSKKFLEKIGCWSNIPNSKLTSVLGMEIYGDSYKSMLELSAWQSSVSQLSWIIEASDIEKSLVKEIIDIGVPWIDDRCFSYKDNVLVTESGRSIFAELFIGADGSNSTLRKSAGIDRSIIDYKEISIVANICSNNEHRGKAFQWFGEHGILALLPLPDMSFGNHLSMVWSVKKNIIDFLDKMNNDQQKSYIENILSDITCRRLGDLKIVSNRILRFNLTLEKSNFIAPGLVFVGESAHRLHPLAGQGLNIGLGDSECLCDILLSKRQNQNFGDIELLNNYNKIREKHIALMNIVIDGIHKLFNSKFFPIKLARNCGLLLLNKMFFLKPIIVKFASKN